MRFSKDVAVQCNSIRSEGSMVPIGSREAGRDSTKCLEVAYSKGVGWGWGGGGGSIWDMAEK
jgi:hypothetical protein